MLEIVYVISDLEWNRSLAASLRNPPGSTYVELSWPLHVLFAGPVILRPASGSAVVFGDADSHTIAPADSRVRAIRAYDLAVSLAMYADRHPAVFDAGLLFSDSDDPTTIRVRDLDATTVEISVPDAEPEWTNRLDRAELDAAIDRLLRHFVPELARRVPAAFRWKYSARLGRFLHEPAAIAAASDH